MAEDNFFDQLASMEEDVGIKKQRVEDKEDLRQTISTELANKTKDKKFFGTTNPEDIEQLKQWISDIINMSGTLLSKTVQKKLIHEMVLEITSLGKIHELMGDSSVSEIMVNGPNKVYVEKNGELQLTDIKFENDREVMDLAIKIATNVGRSINNSHPITDARLPDGSRVHIVIPPIALDGVTITIRKFSEEKLTINDLINFGSISPEAARFLEDLVLAKANIIVSGGTGTGKTTTLNIVSNFIPNNERVLTLEDSAELQLNNDHVVRLETRDANAEGMGSVRIVDLVKASLRMRPSRVILGEVRDGTAFDLLQLLNTGHDGSAATVHSNSPQDCIRRLAGLVLQAGMDMPDRAIKEDISRAIDIIVQITRMSDGSRKISHISEVIEYSPETETVLTKPIFEFVQNGRNEEGKIMGELEYTGHDCTDGLRRKFTMSNLDYYTSLGIEEKTDELK